ncbi:MAG: hypothetical protein K8R54_12890 [Bacteroidales bacterium]|nr:hypothetical protein [Bacteroidales bacterium]
MKHYLFLLLIPLMFACGESKEEIRLKSQVDSLMSITSEDQVTMNEYLKSFNEIQMNLNEIKEKENIITTQTVGDVELEDTDVEAINNDILAIYELMQENKKKLAYLRNKLDKSNSKNKELRTTIKLLNNSIVQKDIELTDLRSQLVQKNIDITELNLKIAAMDSSLAEMSFESVVKDSLITDQDVKLHTAFYIIDTKKNLKNKGILKSDGGFIGIGSNTKVKMKESEFTEVDIRETMEFSLNETKKVQLITDHPEGSYKFEQSADGKYIKLKVINADDFWKMSKYLVISVKE